MAKRKPTTAGQEKVIESLVASYDQEVGATMTLARAARMVGYSVRTMRREIQTGHLIVSRPTKRGDRITVTARRLAEWVVAGEHRSQLAR